MGTQINGAVLLTIPPKMPRPSHAKPDKQPTATVLDAISGFARMI